MEDFLARWWSAVAAVIGAVVWAVRIEAKAMGNSRDIERLWAQRKEDLDAHKEARERTNAILTEIRSDIKTLMRKEGE